MLSFLKDTFFRLLYPWSRADVERWLQPLDIRIAEETDFEECLALHEANVEQGVPSNHREIYAEELRSGRTLTFVAYRDTRIVGTFGIQKAEEGNLYWLLYMLVDPAIHRSGVGAMLFIAAISMLNEVVIDSVLVLGALPTAVGFYERMGCTKGITFTSDTGQLHHFMTLWGIDPALVARSRRLLMKAGVTLPQAGYVIPLNDLRMEQSQVTECP